MPVCRHASAFMQKRMPSWRREGSASGRVQSFTVTRERLWPSPTEWLRPTFLCRCPCLTCSVKIAQVGISEVVYSQSYNMDKEVRYSTFPWLQLTYLYLERGYSQGSRRTSQAIFTCKIFPSLSLCSGANNKQPRNGLIYLQAVDASSSVTE